MRTSTASFASGREVSEVLCKAAIALAPLRFRIPRASAGRRRHSRLDRRKDRLAILPGHEGQAVADQMYDAGLDDHRFGKDAVDRLGKPLQAVDDGDQDVGDAAGPQIVHDLEPEFGAFGLLDRSIQSPSTSFSPDAVMPSTM